MSINPESQISYFKSLKTSFLLIFFTMLVYRILDQFLTKQLENIIKSDSGITSVIWLWAILSLMISILFPTIVSIISLYALKNNTLHNLFLFFKKYFEFSLLETLRAWGTSFLWGILFIIPGLIKMSYYYLTIFVVLFNPDYIEGKIDALKESEKISKKMWSKLNILVFVFFALIPITSSLFFEDYLLFEKHLLTAIFYTAVETTLILLFHFYILKLFLNHKGDQHVTDVQLATN